MVYTRLKLGYDPDDDEDEEPAPEPTRRPVAIQPPRVILESLDDSFSSEINFLRYQLKDDIWVEALKGKEGLIKRHLRNAKEYYSELHQQLGRSTAAMERAIKKLAERDFHISGEDNWNKLSDEDKDWIVDNWEPVTRIFYRMCIGPVVKRSDVDNYYRGICKELLDMSVLRLARKKQAITDRVTIHMQNIMEQRLKDIESELLRNHSRGNNESDDEDEFDLSDIIRKTALCSVHDDPTVADLFSQQLTDNMKYLTQGIRQLSMQTEYDVVPSRPHSPRREDDVMEVVEQEQPTISSDISPDGPQSETDATVFPLDIVKHNFGVPEEFESEIMSGHLRESDYDEQINTMYGLNSARLLRKLDADDLNNRSKPLKSILKLDNDLESICKPISSLKLSSSHGIHRRSKTVRFRNTGHLYPVPLNCMTYLHVLPSHSQFGMKALKNGDFQLFDNGSSLWEHLPGIEGYSKLLRHVAVSSAHSGGFQECERGSYLKRDGNTFLNRFPRRGCAVECNVSLKYYLPGHFNLQPDPAYVIKISQEALAEHLSDIVMNLRSFELRKHIPIDRVKKSCKVSGVLFLSDSLLENVDNDRLLNSTICCFPPGVAIENFLSMIRKCNYGVLNNIRDIIVTLGHDEIVSTSSSSPRDAASKMLQFIAQLVYVLIQRRERAQNIDFHTRSETLRGFPNIHVLTIPEVGQFKDCFKSYNRVVRRLVSLNIANFNLKLIDWALEVQNYPGESTEPDIQHNWQNTERRFHLLFRLCRREDTAYVLYKRSPEERTGDTTETRQGRFRFEMEFDENYLPSDVLLNQLYETTIPLQ